MRAEQAAATDALSRAAEPRRYLWEPYEHEAIRDSDNCLEDHGGTRDCPDVPAVPVARHTDRFSDCRRVRNGNQSHPYTDRLSRFHCFVHCARRCPDRFQQAIREGSCAGHRTRRRLPATDFRTGPGSGLFRSRSFLGRSSDTGCFSHGSAVDGDSSEEPKSRADAETTRPDRAVSAWGLHSGGLGRSPVFQGRRSREILALVAEGGNNAEDRR